MVENITPVKEGCHLCCCPSKSVFELSDDGKGFITREATYKIPTGTITVRERRQQEPVRKMVAPAPVFVSPQMNRKSTSAYGYALAKGLDGLAGIQFQQFRNPLKRKWSGWTFITEIDEKERDMEYKREVKEALRKRKLYQQFLKMDRIHYSKLKSTNAGPEWFQDLSLKQMAIIDRIKDTIRADLEEGHVLGTQTLLDDLGVTPAVSNRKVRRCITTCDLDPIRFLFMIHKCVVDAEEEEYERRYFEAKQQGKHISAFSINERLLLSAVFHIHFPVFLKKLDRILPDPPREPIVRWAKKVLKPKKTYDSPYLEPLPINEKCWYEEEADKEQKREVMRRIKKEKEAKKRKAMEEELSELAERSHKLSTPYSQKGNSASTRASSTLRERKSSYFKTPEEELPALRPPSIKSRPNTTYVIHKPSDITRSGSAGCREDDDLGDGIASVVLLTKTVHSKTGLLSFRSISVQTRSNKGGFFSGDMVLIRETEGESNPNLRYSKRRPKGRERLFHIQQGPEGVEVFFSGCPLVGSFECRSFGTQTVPILEFEPLNMSRLFAPEEKPSVTSDLYVPSEEFDGTLLEFELTSQAIPSNIPGEEDVLQEINDMDGQEDTSPSTEDGFMDPSKSSACIEKNLSSEAKVSTECPFSEKPFTVECPDEVCKLIEEGDVPVDEFTFAKTSISLLPPSKQLAAAVKFLCERGDPLAILPLMDQVPWLVRWHEKRRGIRLKLSKEDQKELMERSNRIWDSEYTKVSGFRIPLLPFTPEEQAALSWDRIKRIKKVRSQTVNKLHRSVKQQLVDNGRDLFPSMFVEYFKTAATQKSFRRVYFTYMPSREKDSWVFRPWKPHEKDEENKEEEE